MTTLIIHPKDNSTQFLENVYHDIPDKTVVTGGVSKEFLLKEIKNHQRIMMMGHGTPNGLLSVGQFPGALGYIIDDTFAPLLAEKANSVFIWCNADQFVIKNGLGGFYTGMFISEVAEAYLMGFRDTTQREVDESNGSFVETVGTFADRGPRLMHAAARHKYGRLASHNRVAKHNYERLYVCSPVAQ